MAVFALVSGKGSPGVTTTMVALTRSWHSATGREALGLDLDPHGGDVAAGVLLGSAPTGTGVLALATDRTDQPSQAVRIASILVTDGGCRLLPGVPDAARAGAIPLAWDRVVAALPDLNESGVDLLIDGGRLTGMAPSPAWLPRVDHTLLLVRPSLPWVTSAHRLASAWPADKPLALVVVDAPSPYSAGEVARAVGRPLVEVLPFDPRAASVHSDGARPERNHRRGGYSRAIDRLAGSLIGLQEERFPDLGVQSVAVAGAETRGVSDSSGRPVPTEEDS